MRLPVSIKELNDLALDLALWYTEAMNENLPSQKALHTCLLVVQREIDRRNMDKLNHTNHRAR